MKQLKTGPPYCGPNDLEELGGEELNVLLELAEGEEPSVLEELIVKGEMKRGLLSKRRLSEVERSVSENVTQEEASAEDGPACCETDELANDLDKLIIEGVEVFEGSVLLADSSCAAVPCSLGNT